MVEEHSDTIYIKELNPDIIAPTTKQLNEPDNFGGSKIAIIGKPGCFVAGTKVLMFNGTTKNVEDVLVGDKIMGDDSKCRNVIELCRNSDEMYEIKPITGKSYTVNKQHKLVLLSPNYKIEEITVEEYLNQSDSYQNEMKIYKTAVEFTNKNLIVDPYTIGLWIGNVEANRVVDMYGLKYIPHEYLYNSRYNRLKLLAGVVDSVNGYTNNTLNFKGKMYDDISFVIRSLGFTLDDNGSIYGNISQIPCDKDINVEYNRPNNLVSSFEVIPKGHGKYYGFTLDGNHRFVLDSFDVVRNTGKSTLIASILYAKKHIFPVAMAFSGSEDSNGFYRKILPSTFVFNEYNEDQIKSFIRRQKIAKQHLPNPWAVILLDDCTDDARVFNTPLQQGMYKRGRHWSMLYIVSLQYAMDIKPVIRTNMDGIFVLREPILKNRRTLWENYGSVVPDFNLFCQLMDQLTDDFCCMYISNQTRSNDWQDCVFWYKAQPIPDDWKFGCPEYRQFHHDRFNEAYVDPFD